MGPRTKASKVARTETGAPVSEAEMRKDAIDALRNFKVTLLDGKEDFVIAHRHMLGQEATLLFQVDTLDGTFIRAGFRHYLKFEEVPKADHNTTTRHDN